MVTITPSERFTTYGPVVPTTAFPVGFPIFDLDDVKLLLDGEDYPAITVSATFVDGIATNAVINVVGGGLTGDVTVVGDRAPRRTDQYQNGAPLPISAHNYSLNRLTAENQEMKREVGRSIKLPFGQIFGLIETPQDGHTLVWDTSGLFPSIVNGLNEQEEAGAWRAQLAAETAARIAGDLDLHLEIDGIIPAVTNLTARAEAAADNAETSAQQAEDLVQAATAGFTGFPDGQSYDFGWITDATTYFNQDWGSI